MLLNGAYAALAYYALVTSIQIVVILIDILKGDK